MRQSRKTWILNLKKVVNCETPVPRMLMENAIRSSSKRRAPVPFNNTALIANSKDIWNYNCHFMVIVSLYPAQWAVLILYITLAITISKVIMKGLVHCCTPSLCYLGGEMIITEIQISIQSSSSWATNYERIAFNVKYSEEVRHCHHGLAPEQVGSFHLLLRRKNPLLSRWESLLATILLWENSLDKLSQLGAVDEPGRKIHLKWQISYEWKQDTILKWKVTKGSRNKLAKFGRADSRSKI